MLEVISTHNMDSLRKGKYQHLKEELQFEAREYLVRSVTLFNKLFARWYKKFGARPDFMWRYDLGGIKDLAIKNTAIFEEDELRPLKAIVERFNQRFTQWRDYTACTANFIWSDGELEYPKTLEVTEINMPIYRREPASERHIQELLSRLSTNEVECRDL